MKVEIDKLEANEWNPCVMSTKERRELRKSIQQTDGRYLQYNPVKVRELEDDRYQIVDGEKRWKVAKELDFEEIPIEILDISEEEAKALSVTLNKNRGTLNYYLLSKLLNDDYGGGVTQSKLGEKYGFSQPRISRILTIYPQLKDYTGVEQLSNRQMEELAQIDVKRFRDVVFDEVKDKNISSTEIREHKRKFDDLMEELRTTEMLDDISDYDLLKKSKAWILRKIEEMREECNEANVREYLDDLRGDATQYDFYEAVDKVATHFDVEETEAGRTIEELIEHNENIKFFIKWE